MDGREELSWDSVLCLKLTVNILTVTKGNGCLPLPAHVGKSHKAAVARMNSWRVSDLELRRSPNFAGLAKVALT